MLVVKMMLVILSVLVAIGLVLTLFMVVRKLFTNKGLGYWTLEDVIEMCDEYGCRAVIENGDVSGFVFDKE